MPDERNKAIRRNDTKTYTDNLLADYNSFGLGNFNNFINSLQVGANAEYIAQYRLVNSDVANKSDNELQRIITQKQEAQKAQLREVATLLTQLQTEIQRYKDVTSHKADDKSLTEAQIWQNIGRISTDIKTKMSGFLKAPLFNTTSDMPQKATWLAEITNKHFAAPMNGNLKMEGDEFEKARQEGRVLKVPTKKLAEQGGNVLTNVFNRARNAMVGPKDMSAYNLFPHNPSKDDITQGVVGDCYLNSAIASIAQNSPDSIRNCMLDKDGTVTVRFFGKDPKTRETKPVYVTIPKEVGVTFAGLGQRGAEGAMWATMIEYAYAYSGLHSTPEGVIKTDAELQKHWADHPTTKSMLDTIDGGNVAEFTRCLLGKDAPAREYSISKYTDLQKFADILNKGGVMSCSSHPDKEAIQKAADKNGIHTQHAYTVVGIDMDAKKVTLRNPHNSGGDRGAEFKMSFDDFKASFTHIDAAEIKDVYSEKDISTVKNNYKSIVSNLSSGLGKQNWLFGFLRDSKQYKEFKIAFGNLETSLKSKTANVSDIVNSMQAAADKAQKYIDYTKTNAIGNNRRENRISVAESIIKLNKMIQLDVLGDPTASYQKALKDMVADKMSKGFEKEFGRKVDMALFNNSPIFNDMFKDEQSIYQAAFETSPRQLMNMAQEKLKLVNQDIKPVKAPEDPQRVNAQQVEAAGPGLH